MLPANAKNRKVFERIKESPDIFLKGMKYQLRKQLCFSYNLVHYFIITVTIISEKRCTFLHRGASCTKNLNKACTKFSQSFKLPICGLVVFINMNTKCINLQKKAGVSKHYWKKIMQLLWTVSTYLLKNVNHGIENDIDSNYGDIGLFWHLQQIWRIPYLAI